MNSSPWKRTMLLFSMGLNNVLYPRSKYECQKRFFLVAIGNILKRAKKISLKTASTLVKRFLKKYKLNKWGLYGELKGYAEKYIKKVNPKIKKMLAA